MRIAVFLFLTNIFLISGIMHNVAISEQWDNNDVEIILKVTRELSPSSVPIDLEARKKWENKLVEFAIDKNKHLSVRKASCRTLGTMRIKDAFIKLEGIITDSDKAYPWALTANIWIQEIEETHKIDLLLKEWKRLDELLTDTKEQKIIKGIKRNILAEEIGYYVSLSKLIPKDLPKEIISTIYVQEKMAIADCQDIPKDKLIPALLKQMKNLSDPRQMLGISSAIEQSATKPDDEILANWLNNEITDIKQLPPEDKDVKLRVSKIAILLDSLLYIGGRKFLPQIEKFSASTNKSISMTCKRLLSYKEKPPSKREKTFFVSIEDSWPIEEQGK